MVFAAINLLVSLLLAWIASFIVYTKNRPLQRIFVSTRYLIRAHIDFLLMSLLLIATYYVITEFSLTVPAFVIVLAIIGAVYNPSGFVISAIKPQLSEPKTTINKIVTLLAFIPATIGFGYPMVQVLRVLI